MFILQSLQTFQPYIATLNKLSFMLLIKLVFPLLSNVIQKGKIASFVGPSRDLNPDLPLTWRKRYGFVTWLGCSYEI